MSSCNVLGSFRPCLNTHLNIHVHCLPIPLQYPFVLLPTLDAGQFSQAIGPSLLGIPHYLTIVKQPMESSMIDARLAVSNLSKPNPNHSVTQYLSIQEFITNMKLMFDNCYLFNGPDHVILQCARQLQAVFEYSSQHFHSLPSYSTPISLCSTTHTGCKAIQPGC